LKQKSNKKIQGCIKIAKIYPMALRRKSYAAALVLYSANAFFGIVFLLYIIAA
jgi:hypothetical protein